MAYRDLMRVATVRSTAAVALALALCSGLVLATLSACAAEPGPTPTTSKATDAPVFASDEEALAAAEKAYAAYLGVQNAVAHDGGRDAGRYAEVAIGDALASATEGADELSRMGYSTIGDIEFAQPRLQSAEYSNEASIKLVLYMCNDVSNVSVIDEAGNPVASGDGPSVTPWQVVVSGASRDDLLVSDRTLWEGTNFCETS